MTAITRLAIYYGIRPHTASVTLSPDGTWRLKGESVAGNPVWVSISGVYPATGYAPDGVAEMHLASLAAHEMATATQHRKRAESADEGAGWLQGGGMWTRLADAERANAQAATLRYKILTGLEGE